MKVGPEDLGSHRAFRKVLDHCKIELKGDVVIVAASLFKWFNDLGTRMEEDLKPKPPLQMVGEVKPITKRGAVKKIGKK